MKINLVLRKDCNYRIDIFNESGDTIAVVHVDDLISEIEPLEKLRKGEIIILTEETP